MSEAAENKPVRTLQQCNEEYTSLCAQAGQAYYKLECLKEDLKALTNAIRKVNMEAASLPKPADSNVTPITEAAKEATNA